VTQLQNSGVSARPVFEAWSNFFKQLGDNHLIPDAPEDLPPSVQITPLGERDQTFSHTT
jgi:hypothetical protein